MKVKKSFSLLVLLVLALTVSTLFVACSKPKPDGEIQKEEPITEDEEIEAEVPLENVRVITPVAVVIANNASARPQSGLQEATRVYEFLVEGGITRFLAIFDNLPAESINIGPVRSIRPYFAHQALEHANILVHGGYSHRTEQMIKGLKLTHIVSSTYLWRDASRNAPHNLYTDADRIEKMAGGSNLIKRAQKGNLIFPASFEDGLNIQITYSASNVVSYTYDSESETYLRSLRGEPHTDRETLAQYRTRRVILRHTRHTAVSGTDLVDIDLSGEGRAFLYEEGRKYELRWEKKDGTTKYYFADGSPVDSSFGNTWIQVVRP